MKLIGAVLLALGILACIYGGFWYSNDATKAELGPIKIKVEEQKRVNVPLWVGVGGIVSGAVLLATSRGTKI